MREEHLSPKEATRKAMRQITGAIVAITSVLAAVFIPSALQSGSTGVIYRQFALTIALSMGFSAFWRSPLPRRCVRLAADARAPARQLLLQLVQPCL